MDYQNVNLAGEFYVLAQLNLQGLVGTLTLGNTKGVDILVSNPTTDKLFRVEVKTTQNRATTPKGKTQFGYQVEWRMDKKHEDISDEKIFYCFVQIESKEKMPRFFIVPGMEVAKFVKEDDKYWRSIPRKKIVKDTSMRSFRIRFDNESHGLDAEKYENKWDYFKK